MVEQSIDLLEVDDLFEPINDREMQYPCIAIYGIETENEFLFFRDRIVKDDSVCLPMYFECEGQLVELGKFPLTLDFLLALRSIGDYTIFLCSSESEKKQIDLNDPDTLIKFIKL